ncbi:MAG: FAD/NAD(P)-binding protein [Acidobacteriota bacterium]|nr:MAG: FAD/NAD(P)-binding protein [Acidobacteriota bacterium]
MSQAPAAADPMVPLPFRVTNSKPETSDTVTLELAPINGEHRVSFAAGQFNMLYAFGVGESAISISGDPSLQDRYVHTLRAIGTVTRALHALREGDVLGLRGPFGNRWPLDRAEGRDVVIVAGGIGLAPLRTAIYRIASDRNRFGQVSVLYGCRTPDDVLYADEFSVWHHNHRINVQTTVDRSRSGWRGRVGVVTTLIPTVSLDPDNVVVMLCGPEVMIHFTVIELHRRRVRDDDIFIAMERNMKCALGFCGRCQLGPTFVCKDGSIFPYSRLRRLLTLKEL